MKEIIEKISKKLGKDCEGKGVTVQKTNGPRDGIQVTLKAHPQVGATFYPNNNISVDENVDGIVDAVYQELTPERIREVLRVTEILKDKDFVRSHLQIKMVNYELNQDWIQDAIYEPILDLAAVVYIVLEQKDDVFKSVMLKKKQLSEIGFSEEEVLDLAKRNIPEPKLMDIFAAVDPFADTYMDDCVMMDCGMYVMSNPSKTNGAASILSPALKKVADINNCDLIIIPSSVHEVILMKDGIMDREFLNQTISEVNADVVDPCEKLSDHAYVYRRKSQTLEFF